MRSLDRGETISLATNSAKISRIRWIQSALGSFMIQTTATKTTENHRALISEQDMFNTHFNKILISSLANGCAGLQDVPIGSVLKHLMRYRHTSSVLLDFLRQSDTYVAKGLAENLFRAAIEARDVVALQVMLRIPSVDVNNILCFPYPTQSRGIKPIFRAAKVESLDMVRALRKAGAIAENSSRKHEDGFLFRKRIIQDQTGTGYSTEDSALVDIAQELLLAGFEPTCTDWNVLLEALKDRNSSMVYALLDAAHEKAQVLDDEYYSTWYNIPDYSSRKILRAAVVWGDEPITTALLTTFPTMLVEYDELAETIENNNLATFNFLVASRRVTPSALCDSLQYAIRKGDENMIKTFLDLGADCTDNGVLKAATNASLPILELVLSKPPTLQRLVAPGNGRDALERAIRKGTRGLPMVQRLLQSNAVGYGLACLTSWDEESCQIAPLGLAIKQCCEDNDGDLKVVKLFLDAGQHPDSVVKYEHDLYPDFPPELKGPGYELHYRSNTTALLLSIEYRNTRLIKLLLDRGANVDLPATCRILRTPLQKACEVGSLEIVQLLLDRGANPSSKPARCQGATALQLAAISGNCNIAAELLDRGADLDQPPVKAGGRWPLEGAAEHGRLEMIEFLWKASGGRGFDKPICDFAIKVAEQRGHFACRDLIKDLMENGVSEFDSDLMSDVFGVIP